MTVLHLLGLVSFVFVAVFTVSVWRNNDGAGQTPRSSLIEAWVNILLGFSVNYLANWLLLPMVGAHFTMSENFWLGWVYTAISIVRQYVIRRWFNNRLHNIAVALSKGN